MCLPRGFGCARRTGEAHIRYVGLTLSHTPVCSERSMLSRMRWFSKPNWKFEKQSPSPATARKVIDAARELDLPRKLPTSYRQGVRLDVLLASQERPFFRRVSEAVVRTAATLDRSIVIQRTFIEPDQPHQLAKRILATSAHGLVLYGTEDAAVIEAVATVAAAGISVVTLISDLPTSYHRLNMHVRWERALRWAPDVWHGMRTSTPLHCSTKRGGRLPKCAVCSSPRPRHAPRCRPAFLCHFW